MKKILLLIALLPFYAVADFLTALDTYEKGEYQSAYNQFLSMAKIGEIRSQFNLGVMYYNGQHVSKDINHAYAWLKLSTSNNTATDAEKQTFEQIASKISDKSDAELVFKSIEKYSNENLLTSLYPEFLTPNNENAFSATPIKIVQPKYPRYAAMNGIQGWTKFRFDLDKKGHPRNIMLIESVPEKIFEKTAIRVIPKWQFKPSTDEKGNAIDTKSIVYTMSFRMGGQDSMSIKESAIKRAKIGLENNDPRSQLNLALWSQYGLLPNEKYNATELFLKAAVQGHPVAQYEVGRSLVFGQGCKQDKTKGLTWLNRAASNGQPDAKELLANVLMSKQDLASQQKAVEYYGAIEKKSARTSINLARLLTSSTHSEILNPDWALDIIDDISNKTFRDDITLEELKAAAYFKLGKVRKAISYQEDALEEAEDTGADTTKVKKTLAKYIAYKSSIST